MPLVDAYLSGDGDLEAAAAELVRFMPLHGNLFGKDKVVPPDVEERGHALMTRVRARLAELRAAADETD